MQTKNPLLIVIILIVLALLAFFFYDSDKDQIIPDQASDNVATETGSLATNTDSGTDVPQSAVTIEYTDDGFSPNTVTISAGDTIRFINNGDSDMWVASALHPTHQVLPAFDQREQTEAGGVYEFIFTEVGSWKYHNHVQASHTGSITVTEG